MPKVSCSVNACVHNDDGACEARAVYISDIEDGYPKCMTAIWIEDVAQENGRWATALPDQASARR